MPIRSTWGAFASEIKLHHWQGVAFEHRPLDVLPRQLTGGEIPRRRAVDEDDIPRADKLRRGLGETLFGAGGHLQGVAGSRVRGPRALEAPLHHVCGGRGPVAPIGRGRGARSSARCGTRPRAPRPRRCPARQAAPRSAASAPSGSFAPRVLISGDRSRKRAYGGVRFQPASRRRRAVSARGERSHSPCARWGARDPRTPHRASLSAVGAPPRERVRAGDATEHHGAVPLHRGHAWPPPGWPDQRAVHGDLAIASEQRHRDSSRRALWCAHRLRE